MWLNTNWFELIVFEMSNHGNKLFYRYQTAVADEKVTFGGKILLDSFGFNIFDKLLHAQACIHTAWNAAKQTFSTKINFQICTAHIFSVSAGLSLSLALFTFLVLALICTLDLVHTRVHVRTHKRPLCLSLGLPRAQSVVGVCRCVSWSASSTGSSHASVLTLSFPLSLMK